MLTWNWKKINGFMSVRDERGTTNNILYAGNALLIAININKEKEYNLQMFFCDEEHMKNCLGLTKGYNNIYENKKVNLHLTKCKECDKIAKIAIKAHWNIKWIENDEIQNFENVYTQFNYLQAEPTKPIQ